MRYLAILFLGLLLAFAERAAAHPQLIDYVQHRCLLRAGAANFDIEVELTFRGLRTLTERRRMDADHDGLITHEEQERYVAVIEPTLEAGLHMAVDGRTVTLLPLYEPRLELTGRDTLSAGQHVLRLYYFARRPAWLRPGSRIVLEDSLWAAAPAIIMFRAINADGIEVADAQADGLSTPDATPKPRVMSARCVAVPVDNNESANPERKRRVVSQVPRAHT